MIVRYSNSFVEGLLTSVLFRWRIVIHGGIDGFSRIPVYLLASNNNKAETVATAFIACVAGGTYSRARENGKLEIPPAQKLHILSSAHRTHGPAHLNVLF